MPNYRGHTTPSCPHCGNVIMDPCDLFDSMEETIEADCESCEEMFSITRSVVFYYDADKNDPQEQQP